MMINQDKLETVHIAGIGVDLISVSRVENIFKKYDYKFVEKVLVRNELNTFSKRISSNYQRGIRFLASRISVKEAFSKAIGIGMVFPMSWSSIEIVNSIVGKPYCILLSPLKEWFENCYGAVHVSLSDEKSFVVSNVMIERKI